MSGRVHFCQPDGRITVGFRKTGRINHRPRPVERPEYIAIFQLPTFASWATTPGPHGSAITVGERGTVRARSFDRGYTLRKAAEFLQTVASGHGPINLSGVLQIGRGSRETFTCALSQNGAVNVMGRHGRRAVFLPAKTGAP